MDDNYVMKPRAGVAVFGVEKGEGQGFRIFSELNLRAVFEDWGANKISSPPEGVVPREGEILHTRCRIEHEEKCYELLSEYRPCGRRFDKRPAYIGSLVFACVEENECLEPNKASSMLDELLFIAGKEGKGREDLRSIDLNELIVVTRPQKDADIDDRRCVLCFDRAEDEVDGIVDYRASFYSAQARVACTNLYGAFSKRLQTELRDFLPAKVIKSSACCREELPMRYVRHALAKPEPGEKHYLSEKGSRRAWEDSLSQRGQFKKRRMRVVFEERLNGKSIS